MANCVQDRARLYEFEFDFSTIEDEAPEDELREIIKQQQQLQQRAHHREFSHNIFYNSSSTTNKNTSSSLVYQKGSDESRSPLPPMEIATNSSSNHPDFEAWKRDMKRTLLAGTVRTSLSSSSLSLHKNNLDSKSARLNKRRLDKKLLHRQLGSVESNSDTSTTTEEFSDEENDAGFRNRKPLFLRECFSEHDLPTVYYVKPNNNICNTTKIEPLSPRSATFQRPTLSANDFALSEEQIHPNSSELAEIMMEFSNLKIWAAEGGASTNLSKSNSNLTSNSTSDSDLNSTSAQLRTSTPPSSPGSPKLSTERKEEEAKELIDPLESIAVPQIASRETKSSLDPQTKFSKPVDTPKGAKELINPLESIVVPQIASRETKSSLVPQTKFSKPVDTPKNKHKTMITKQIADKDKGKTTEKKRVRFREGFVTDTFYRPWTPEEDIDDLYFQEEELLIWEEDEATTLQDRFEVVVTEFGGEEENEQTFSGKLSIGTPVVSFHDSHSYSYHEDSDDESYS